MTALRTLVKCHKCLKKQNHLSKVVLVNNCSEKFDKHQMKELFMKSFFSQVVACDVLKKNSITFV